jgi:hypothetical protein
MHKVDLQDELLKRNSAHLRHLVPPEFGLKAFLGVQAEAGAGTDTAGTTAAL